MSIVYALESNLSMEDFRTVLIASTLGERRPVNDADRLEKMLRHADVIITARDNSKIVGVSRAITDFSFVCYLSDLAVDAAYQGRGIGTQLIDQTHIAAGTHVSLFLVSAPAAVDYYPKIGMKNYPCFGIPSNGCRAPSP